MADFALDRTELKAMIKLAKRKPVSFAFNPGRDVSEHYLGMHRKKPARVLGRDAKQNGPGTRVAFGTATVDQRLLVLRCDKIVPKLAKALKRYLKQHRVQLNVQVYDADGELVDADIEDDLPDDPELGGAAEKVSDQRSLLEALTETRARIAGLPNDAAARLKEPFAKIVTAAQGGKDSAARKGLQALSAALDKLETRQENGDVAALGKRLQTLRDRIQALQPTVAKRLSAPFKAAVEQLRSGEVQAALTGVEKLEAALDGLEAAQPQQASARPDVTRLLGIWEDAKAMADAGIEKLQVAMRASDEPAAQQVAEFGLLGFTEGRNTSLMRAFLEMRSAQGDAIEKSVEKLKVAAQDYRTFLSEHPAFQLFENNPLGIPVKVRGPLTQALQQIEGELR